MIKNRVQLCPRGHGHLSSPSGYYCLLIHCRESHHRYESAYIIPSRTVEITRWGEWHCLERHTVVRARWDKRENRKRNRRDLICISKMVTFLDLCRFSVPLHIQFLCKRLYLPAPPLGWQWQWHVVMTLFVKTYMSRQTWCMKYLLVYLE